MKMRNENLALGWNYKIIAHFFRSLIRGDYFVKDRKRSERVGFLLPAERRMEPFGMTSELDFWRCNLKQSFKNGTLRDS